MVRVLLRSMSRSLAFAGLALLLASPAGASPETLKRSVGNILMAPLDLVLSPFMATKVLITNLRNIDDTNAVRITYAVPGLIWNTGLQGGAALLRELTGLIEFVPGLGLFFFEADLDPLFDPVEKADALVDIETPPLWIKFGVNYLD